MKGKNRFRMKVAPASKLAKMIVGYCLTKIDSKTVGSLALAAPNSFLSFLNQSSLKKYK